MLTRCVNACDAAAAVHPSRIDRPGMRLNTASYCRSCRSGRNRQSPRHVPSSSNTCRTRSSPFTSAAFFGDASTSISTPGASSASRSNTGVVRIMSPSRSWRTTNTRRSDFDSRVLRGMPIHSTRRYSGTSQAYSRRFTTRDRPRRAPPWPARAPSASPRIAPARSRTRPAGACPRRRRASSRPLRAQRRPPRD